MQTATDTLQREHAMVSHGVEMVHFDTFSSKNEHDQMSWSSCATASSEDFADCSFTGKELDTETGYGYFGARYMDFDLLTGWLSVDPMSDKYPSISPYNYCMWNPIKITDPNGMDTIIFDGNGNFANRIKAPGKHMGLVTDESGNKKYDFEFSCQQDADRCCGKGSEEELEMGFKDKLAHGKNCPAEELVPITRIKEMSKKEIDSQLEKSGACDKHFFSKLRYALKESEGGKLDFYNVNRSTGRWDDNTLYIPMTSGKKYAHNASNLGNYLWGAAMHKMGITLGTAQAGAHLHALWKHGELDSKDDQRSIRLGYFNSMTHR